ncbi:MAG: biotin carboxylase N-terminal domain-containing protein [Candidatus Limnocylindrales bacterium]
MTTADATSQGASSLRKDRSGRPFRRVLIANRGEIAVRIIRACRALGVETVAVYSDADVQARHVRMADVAVRLGGAAPAASYLRADLIVQAGLAHGVEAIHPGYGFLSERATFARAVIAAGIAFIGPDPAAIDALGDKMAARRTAQAADVPVVPGTFEPARVDRPDLIDLVMRDAERIGFPLLVKASAGGGGRGMRRVASAAELPAALAAGAAEAESAFGDGSVYLEREIRPARHIEVQLIGDQYGSIVALGERDCSIQRRHQKLIEESPAPDLTNIERATLHAMAVRAATAAGLHNAATAEFLFDDERRFWFLEVNARLQVEHGVTELVSGIDLVREQLWIAAGAPLSPEVHVAAMSALAPTRHAIEVRLSAEDPARDFAPTPGRIGAWVMPSGPGIRVDSAVEAGERIPRTTIR